MSKYSSDKDIRRNKMVEKFNVLLNDEILSRNIEKSIYNYVIDTAKEKYYEKME